MLLQGNLAELMAMIDPNLYIKFGTFNINRESMLYVKIQKAIYGFQRSVLLFYNIRVKYLGADGFILNQYKLCVDNNMVNRHHIKFSLHVYNFKVSHKDPFETTIFAAYLKSIYGEKL